ncbi:MAG: translation elongation factor Ts [Bacteroidales bacterium]|jgi:elongation factor Ts|nr:translation elongation factor Ts [Bacteroidales bacterium]MCU0409767.1 translation elongation factor Ts [Bacteroidales bacterium]
MSTINAADVAKLRRMTGAGMMDCKKALEEAAGDFEKAQEIIRKRGQAIANKRADREATEGVVLARSSADGKTGMIIALNCETDFVAKNADFIALGYSIIDAALKANPADLDGLKGVMVGDKKAADLVLEKSGITGEKFELSYFGKVEAAAVQPYIHPGNKLATLVGFSKGGIDVQVYKDVAMQVAAMNPVSVDKDDVPEKVLAQELEIGREQARREGKPEDMIEKIAQGKLNKFFKESTLMNQEFVKDNKLTIRQYLESKDKALKATAFIRYTLNV